jgi:hypothetical protein
MAYLDDFRALASVLVNENISPELKKRANESMEKIMDVMDKSVAVEKRQIEDFMNKISSNIEVING